MTDDDPRHRYRVDPHDQRVGEPFAAHRHIVKYDDPKHCHATQAFNGRNVADLTAYALRSGVGVWNRLRQWGLAGYRP